MKSTELGMSVHLKQGLSLAVYVDDIKMGGGKQNVAPMWKTLMELVHLDERTSLFDHENGGDALDVNVIRTKTQSINIEKCANHECLRQQLNNYQDVRNLARKNCRVVL